MAKKDDKDKKDWDPFGFGFGGFGEFDTIVKKMMSDFSKMFEEPDLFKKEGKPKVYGFSLKVGPDGKPQFQSFGDVMPQKKEVPGVREPFSDVIDKGKELNVIVELPGVEKGDIDLNCQEKDLTVKVDKGGIKYFKKIVLPESVLTNSVKATYKNGILEVVIEKKCPSKEKGTKVKVE
jgi:HSP20 family protein